jgi:cytochrome c
MKSGVVRIGMTLAALAGLSVPAARAQDGESLFKRQCGACHTVEAGRNKIGPSLAGIAGKKAAAVEDFDYSDALRSAKITWDDDALTKYLTDPKGLVPGGKMVFAGMKDPDDVKAVIAFLKESK